MNQSFFFLFLRSYESKLATRLVWILCHGIWAFNFLLPKYQFFCFFFWGVGGPKYQLKCMKAFFFWQIGFRSILELSSYNNDELVRLRRWGSLTGWRVVVLVGLQPFFSKSFLIRVGFGLCYFLGLKTNLDS